MGEVRPIIDYEDDRNEVMDQTIVEVKHLAIGIGATQSQ